MADAGLAAFPSYERIAEAAGCARSTVAEAISAVKKLRFSPDAAVEKWPLRGSPRRQGVAI